MDVSKTKTPPIRAELKFGPAADDILVMLLDADVVTSDFLIDMDASARRIFSSQLAGIRKEMMLAVALPKPDTSKAAGEAEPGNRRSRRASKKARAELSEAETRKTIKRIAEKQLSTLEEMLPSPDESVPLAQAQQLTYYAESIARVVIAWELTDNGVLVEITEKRDLDCCKAANSDCRHAGPWLRSRSRTLLERLFNFACFEGQTPEKKTA